jgi:alcohol dehydrogenase (NADP+)
MIQSHGYAAHSAKTPLEPWSFTRRDPGPTDVVVDILFSGVCHSDIHQARSEWGPALYPMVPGHEIIGTVTAIGKDVRKFKVGDTVGVGVEVSSCRKCSACKADLENYCEVEFGATYNHKDSKTGELLQGGYSNNIVVDEHFTHHVSRDLDLAGAAPLLCAGITTYSPLRHWGVTEGKKVGVVGLGGLGHMALKFAHSFGAHVVQFTTSLNKKDDAIRLGADEVVLSKDPDAMNQHKETFDFILDTVSAPHDINPYLHLLKREATLCNVGIPTEPMQVQPFPLALRRRSLAGSAIGGMKETQEMLNYCAEHGIVSDIEHTPIQKINEAFERVVLADVKYRFVIDMSSLK